MTDMDRELATLAQQGDLASFCPQCHAALNVYDPETRRIWVGLDVEVGDVACDLLVNPRLEEFERVCSPCWTGDALATDVHCPHCHATLIEDEGLCGECESRVFTIDVSLRTRVAPLSCCTRADCHWHGVPKRTRAKILAGTPRQKKPEQDPKLRVRNFQEVSYGYDSELAVVEANRCIECKNMPASPAARSTIDIPAFVRQVAQATSPARAARSARRTCCRPSAAACARRRTSARRVHARRQFEPVAIGAPRAVRRRLRRETMQFVDAPAAGRTDRAQGGDRRHRARRG